MKALYILLILFSHSVQSNDGIAGFKGGKVELNFNSNTNISMKSEILKISQAKVEVDYTFFNDSKNDEEVLIAFPFPEIDCGDFKFNMDNKFSGLVNGELIPLNEEITIKSKGKDITEEVKRLGIKLCRDDDLESEMSANIKLNITNPEKFKFHNTCRELIYYSNDKRILDKFIKLCKLGYGVEGSDSDGAVSYVWGPSWKLSKKAYFKVNFPAMKETRIQHFYIPWSGSGSYEPKGLDSKKFGKIKELPIWAKGIQEFNKNPLRYVMDIDTYGSSVEYILKTANTWKGPIKNFKLILDRSDGIVVSNYIKDYELDGINLVWETKDFVPKEDLVVSFLRYRFVEKSFTGSVSEVEKQEFLAISKEYDSLDLKNKESVNNLINRFKAYIAKYGQSKNLPQAFSMLDYLENDIN